MRKILYELVKVAFCIAITAMIQFSSEGIFGDEWASGQSVMMVLLTMLYLRRCDDH